MLSNSKQFEMPLAMADQASPLPVVDILALQGTRHPEPGEYLSRLRRDAAELRRLPLSEAASYFDTLLGINPACSPQPLSDLTDCMPYARSPIGHAVRAIAALRLTGHDKLMDVGCGPAHIPILAALLTPAEIVGVDFNPVLIEEGQAIINRHAIDRVHLVHADAREVDFSGINCFYCFAPFYGEVLRVVLDRLRAHSEATPIRLAGVGPLWNSELYKEPWLEPLRNPRLTNRGIEIFESR